jgi:hypothetical protein
LHAPFAWLFSWISSCAPRDASLTAHSNNIDRSLVNFLSSVLFSLPHCRSWAFDFVKTNGTYWPDALLEKRPPSNPNRMVLATLMACLAKRLAKDGQVLCNRLRRGYLDCLVRANRHLPTYNHHHNAFDSSLREPFVLFHFGDTSSPITWFWVCIDLTLWSNMSHVVKCKREAAPASVFFCWTRQSSLRLSGLAVIIFFTIYIATNLPCIIQHEGRFLWNWTSVPWLPLRWAAFVSPRSKLDQMSRHGAFHQSDKKLLVGLSLDLKAAWRETRTGLSYWKACISTHQVKSDFCG